MNQLRNNSSIKSVLDLTDIITSLKQIAQLNNFKSAENELCDLEEKLHKQTIYIVILGLFKRGKSSIINSLIDDNLAPVAITPLTSVITFFHYAESKSASILFESGESKIIDINEISEYVSEDLNPENNKKVKRVDVFCPSDLLRNLVLVDTPGLGSLYEHNSQTTKSFIPKIDAALFVLSADLPMSKADGEFLKDINAKVPKFIFILNKKDLVKEDELKKLKEFNIKNIAQLTQTNIGEVELISVSAKQYIESPTDEIKKESGIIELRQNIVDIVNTVGTDLIKESTTKQIQNISNQITQFLSLQRAAYNTPIKDIEAQLDHLTKSLTIIQSSQSDFLSVIKNRIKLIQDDVTQLVNNKAKEIKVKCRNRLLNNDFLESVLKKRGSQEFISDLNIEIRENYTKLYQQIEMQVKQKFTDIMLGFVNQSQHFLNELSSQLENQLGTKIDVLIGKFDLNVYSPFYIRNIPEHHISISKFNPIINLLPKTITHKLFVKNVLRELDDVITSNSAAMLYDITYRMDESLRKMTYDLKLKTSELINELITILTKSKASKDNMEKNTKDDIDKIDKDLLRIEKIKERL